MNPSRPYKVLKDIVTDIGEVYTSWMTLNLFECDNWEECSNQLEGFKDDIKRTIVRIGERTFIIQANYKAFDNMMIQLKADYGMLDNRSLIPPDKIGYQGFISLKGAEANHILTVTFIRKDFQPQNYEEFAYHAIFTQAIPMS